MLHQSFWPAHRKVGKTPLPSLFMDMLQTPPLSQPKFGYNKNCAIKCDSLPLLLPFLGFFFFFFLYLNKICAPASVPSETYDQVFLELDFFHAVPGAGNQVMAGGVAVLASPCLSCKPAQLPSIVQPLQPWDALWASHWVLVPEIHAVGTTEVQIPLFGNSKGPTEKALLKSAPTSPRGPEYMK